MALFRIACAAAALCYIAPHFGGQIIESARPAAESAKVDTPADATIGAVMAYCQQHREACIRFARLAVEEVDSRGSAPQTETGAAETPHSGGPRSILPGFAPLPPVRPVFEKP